ncbi:MAG: cation:proton antiporter [bacterium]
MPLSVAFAVLIIGPWLFGRASRMARLPSILGMLLFGLLWAALSGDVVSFVPEVPTEVEAIAPFIKTTALIVILLRAGLGIRTANLQAVGGSAIRMAVIPCLLETAATTVAFHWLFGFDWLTALVGGSILSAVSPAVVVPSMLDLKERGYHDVPTLVLAGASVDDAVAITIFTAAAGLAAGGAVSTVGVIVSFPLAIANGLVLGVLLGFAAAWFFSRTFERVAHEMASKLAKLWVPAEIFLFVLIGLAVDLPVAVEAGGRGLAVIGIGLIGRSAGVLVSLLPDRRLTSADRIFALVAYLPKATVQAALGAMPLAMGIEGGDVILSVAVLAIVVTAPVGLVLIRTLGPRLLALPREL